jgi:hypothetical protein
VVFLEEEWLIKEIEIIIGKWSLLCGSDMVDQVEEHIRLGEQKDMSMAELGWFGLPTWVAATVFRILRPKELIVL